MSFFIIINPVIISWKLQLHCCIFAKSYQLNFASPIKRTCFLLLYHIENTSEFESTVKKIVHRFAKLGGLMLNGWAGVHRLWINADGTEYEFSGNTVTEDYHRIVREIGSASHLEIVAEYRYKSEYYTEIFLFASEIAERLYDLIQKNKTEIPDGLFYATYNAVADYISDNEMFAYGKKDNRTYNGEVTNEDAECLLTLIEERCVKSNRKIGVTGQTIRTLKLRGLRTVDIQGFQRPYFSNF